MENHNIKYVSEDWLINGRSEVDKHGCKYLSPAHKRIKHLYDGKIFNRYVKCFSTVIIGISGLLGFLSFIRSFI